MPGLVLGDRAKLLDICHGRIERENRLTLILVFEYVEQDLDHFLKNCPAPSLEPPTIKHLMHQVLCGVDFLHQNRIIHRDLKPQNLLVDRYHRVKIADFGLARIYDFHMRLTTMVVTLWYRAPEVLLSNSYATPVDVWSCGCIFAELYRRRPLFEGQTEGDQLQRIFDVIGKPLESEWPRDVSLSLTNFRDHLGTSLNDLVPEITPDAVDLLRKLLKFVPGNRICANDALKHPYFRGMTTPRAIASSNRSTPTQQMLATSPLTTCHLRTIATSPSTVSSTTVVQSGVLVATSSSTSHNSSNIISSISSSNNNNVIINTIGSSVVELGSSGSRSDNINNSNDENNPNAGNSTGRNIINNNNNNNHGAESIMMAEPKLSERNEQHPSNVDTNSQGSFAAPRATARMSPSTLP